VPALTGDRARSSGWRAGQPASLVRPISELSPFGIRSCRIGDHGVGDSPFGAAGRAERRLDELILPPCYVILHKSYKSSRSVYSYSVGQKGRKDRKVELNLTIVGLKACKPEYQ
jgi:hypothetical protein